jgi:cell wall-associated NlpC family hydrolase
MHYTVKPGDSLSKIASQSYHNPADWSGIYVANEKLIGGNPNLIEPGQDLVMPANGSSPPVAMPVAAPAPVVAHPADEHASPSHQSAVSPPVQGSSSFQQCVIARESGGNPSVVNGSGHYGLYQFSEGTWEEYGGSAASFGDASVAQQNQVFDNAMATAGGASNWSPYDGCTDAVVNGAARGTTAAVVDSVVLTAAQAAHEAHLAHLAHLRYLAAHKVVASTSRDEAALNWAVANANGHSYLWGGTGPSYDCSGLVMEAFLHEGVTLPRTTTGMLGSYHLHRVSSPSRGDLAFFGSGHVEFYVRPGETFGAHDAAEGIGYMGYSGSWGPSAYYSVS